jgi:hypothetical protein
MRAVSVTLTHTPLIIMKLRVLLQKGIYEHPLGLLRTYVLKAFSEAWIVNKTEMDMCDNVFLTNSDFMFRFIRELKEILCINIVSIAMQYAFIYTSTDSHKNRKNTHVDLRQTSHFMRDIF